MKKAILSIAVLSVLGFSTVSYAAYSLGPSGQISFSGSLNAVTCSVTDSGAAGSGSNLSYSMGAVSTSALGTEAAPTVVPGASPAPPAVMNLRLACSGTTSVELTLTPTTRSGRGIAVSGGATNVQIMLMQGSTALDFTSGSVTLPATLSGGFAMMPLNAYYTLQAGKTASDVTGGPANGSVAYVLSYN
ncbi:fimbrial protein [Comamonas testosteroni]|uniref:fimbrial protein n=1 Tax=Comamonas testosteroni TaxID=285 RepID=UPI003899ED9E